MIHGVIFLKLFCMFFFNHCHIKYYPKQVFTQSPLDECGAIVTILCLVPVRDFCFDLFSDMVVVLLSKGLCPSALSSMQYVPNKIYCHGTDVILFHSFIFYSCVCFFVSFLLHELVGETLLLLEQIFLNCFCICLYISWCIITICV